MSSPEQRSAAASVAAHTRWAFYEVDRSRATAAARANSPTSWDYWLRKVDPDGALTYEQRLARARNARTAWYRQTLARARRARATSARKRPA